jgi:hypothetical protein
MKKKLIGVEPDTFNKLFEYLQTRPHREVNGILVSLSSSVSVDVEFSKPDETPTSNEGAEPPTN